MKKTRIHIDEERCIGCAQCANVCQTGAIEMVNGKAKLVRENACDHFGNCIGKCPVDAITFEEYEVSETAAAAPHGGGCPSSRPQSFGGGCPSARAMSFSQPAAPAGNDTVSGASELNAWPVQLHLVRPDAAQFCGTDVLVAATCVPFAYAKFHQVLLKGKGLVIACPKLDRQDGYIDKLADMFSLGKPRSVTVVKMEVPCCNGLSATLQKARAIAKSELPIREVTISLRGEMLGERYL